MRLPRIAPGFQSLTGLALVAALLSGAPVSADPMDTAAYDLLFRQGTLDAIAPEATLLYHREVSNALKPETGTRDTGEITLDLAETEPPEARLEFTQGDMHRSIGTFPASVGNPIIMYFVETVVRDMAESTGGSPFYIRNRVKEALVSPAEITEGEAEVGGEMVPATVVVIQPFKGDPNAARMQGFAGMTLTVVMSDEVPGWYQSLAATAPGAEGAAVYSSELRFEALNGEGGQ